MYVPIEIIFNSDYSVKQTNVYFLSQTTLVSFCFFILKHKYFALEQRVQEIEWICEISRRHGAAKIAHSENVGFSQKGRREFQ